MSIARRSLQWLVVVVIVCGLLLSPRLATPARALGATWYVATTGSDANSCSATNAPCKTINGAIVKAAAGDTLKVAVGTYYSAVGANEVVLIDRNLTLSGGWDAAFSSQTGLSTIDGQAFYRGVTINDNVVVTIDRFFIQHGSHASQGAGIDNRGNLTLTNSVIANNSTTGRGGGINVSFGTLVVSNSTIRNNTAGTPGASGGGGGGAIEISGSTSSAMLNNSTLSGNQILGSYSGSAIETAGTVYINNTTISGNSGTYALSVFIGQVVLNNTTITANTGGIDNYAGTVLLANSIVAGNVTSGSADSCSGTIRTLGYNLIDVKNRACTFLSSTGDLVGTAAAPIKARLGPLQDNGGPTLTHALNYGSPALNAGNPGVPGSGGNACLATDQRGFTRPVQRRCDIGAYEGRLPMVLSITRLRANPNSAANVAFLVKFSDAVTGVNIGTASDFSLTKTGVTGAAIKGLFGTGALYTVIVSTGSGNGTIRLNLVDDDTIRNLQGVPLGGLGVGNANFTAGQTYTISKIPVPKAPTGTITSASPTYQWTKVPRATKYLFQLYRGTTPLYSTMVASSVCTTLCSATPGTVLPPGDYKWRVRALIDGAWKPYSPFKPFTLVAP